MYNRHFGLDCPPFRMTPDTRRFFGGGKRAEFLATLVYAISRGEGTVRVTGEIGTGKTMLCRMLEERLPEHVEVVYLANPGLQRGEIVTAIATELQLPEAATASRLQQHQRLQTYLLDAHRQGRQVVVFIEEAQRMPLESLEEIRLLSNLETSQAKLLQVVMFGQPELNQRLEKHEIRQLKDRITHSLQLTPLSSAEVRDYVRFRLHGAGYTGDELFTPAAARQLARSSRGLIRRLHVLADKAMLAAYADNATRVGWRHVRRAARDDRPARSGAWRSRLPVGLVPGLVAGVALALLLAQANRHQLEPYRADRPAARATLSQKIDDLKQRAVRMQPAAGLPLVSRRLQATQRWLTRSGGQGLTIQLLLSHDDDPAKLEKLLGDQPYRDLLPDIYLQRSDVNGRSRWNLLYGDFATRSQALAALADLPERVRRHQPFLRSIAALRPEPEGLVASANREDKR